MERRTTTINRTTSLASPPEVVFAVVNSPETAPIIDPAVRAWQPDSRPIGVGTQFRIRGRLGGMPFRARSEAVSWEPPTLSEFRSVSPSWPYRMTAHHRFDERADGGTDYSWSIVFIEQHVVTRPLIAISKRLFERALSAQAVALARYLDDRRPDDPLPPL